MTKEHKARKRFGQNFLQDQSIIGDIIRAVRPQENDVVVEIGPGLGALTQPLSGCLKQLHVIEIDRDIVAYLKNTTYAGKLVIHEGDVLKMDFRTIQGAKKIVGNLPYNISTPLLFKLTEFVDEIVDMHFMLQKEVVERICAKPDSKDYGRLSVILQYFFDAEKMIAVPPAAFSPAPKVDSAVVRMIPQVGRIGQVRDFALFHRLVTQAFSMRRKTIRNNLKDWVNDETLQSVAIHPNDRPEHIAPELFVALSNALTP